MNRRMDANRALKNLNKFRLHGKQITLAWAPGKGMKVISKIIMTISKIISFVG